MPLSCWKRLRCWRRGEKESSSPRDGVGMIESIRIEAPIDIVWNVLVNVENYPSVYKTCTGVRAILERTTTTTAEMGRLKNSAEDTTSSTTPSSPLRSVRPGVRYVESRDYREQGSGTFELEAAVTVVDEENRRLVITSEIFGCTGTSTHVVVEQDDGESSWCRLEISFGMSPRTLHGRLYLFLFRKWLVREGSSVILLDLEDICVAAEQRSVAAGKEAPAATGHNVEMTSGLTRTEALERLRLLEVAAEAIEREKASVHAILDD